MAQGLIFIIALFAGKALAGFEDAIEKEDTCQEGSSVEECSLSLRQLRGELRAVEVNVHVANNSDSQFFCCLAARDSANPCGTCHSSAVAAADSECHSKDKCGSPGCGGSWCSAVCVMAAANKNDMCGTAFPGSIAKTGDYCSEGEKNCNSCKGKWCGAGSKAAGKVSGAAVESLSKTPPSSSSGFCCYAGSSPTDTCGTCYPEAIEAGKNASTEDACRTTGGSWCATGCLTTDEKGVQSFYTPSTFCAKSQEQCTSTCQASWGILNHKIAAPVVAQLQDSDAGFCCYAGSSTTDTCGTCYPAAIASDVNCSGLDGCKGCGGTWCASGCSIGTGTSSKFFAAHTFCANAEAHCTGACKGSWKVADTHVTAPVTSTPESTSAGFCCYSSSSTSNTCGTCYPEAIATDANCSQADNCKGCGGTWCSTGCSLSSSLPSKEVKPKFYRSETYCAKTEGQCTDTCKGSWGVLDQSVTAPVVESVESSTAGFCCYAGESKSDTCGTCYSEAIAIDANCSHPDRCGSCGGKWCASVCAVASSGSSKASKDSFFASGSYCSKSAEHCTDTCKATWKVNDHTVKADIVAKAKPTEAGFCCYAGSSPSNTCGTCFPEARLTSENCSTSSTCQGCGGTWCATACAADAKKPDAGFYAPTSLCAQSEDKCTGTCKGSWSALDNNVPARAVTSNSTKATSGFCCYASKSSDNTCGTCYPDAIATDDTCSLESECGGCGGTWCATQCVMSAGDSKSCNAENGIFEATAFCSKNKGQCEDTCHGSWCTLTKGVPPTKKASQEEGGDDGDSTQLPDDPDDRAAAKKGASAEVTTTQASTATETETTTEAETTVAKRSKSHKHKKHHTTTEAPDEDE